MIEMRIDCNECDSRNSVVLVINKQGVFTRCEHCGFTEWEWAPGDNIEHLYYLANLFKINVNRILRAVEDAIEGWQTVLY